MKKKDIEKCPECGSKNLVIDKKNKDIICKDCGLVIEYRKRSSADLRTCVVEEGEVV